MYYKRTFPIIECHDGRRLSFAPSFRSSDAFRLSNPSLTRAADNSVQQKILYDARNVKTRRKNSTTQSSRNALEIETLESVGRIDVGDIDIYVPWDTLVKVFGSACRTIVFGQVKKAIVQAMLRARRPAIAMENEAAVISTRREWMQHFWLETGQGREETTYLCHPGYLQATHLHNEGFKSVAMGWIDAVA